MRIKKIETDPRTDTDVRITIKTMLEETLKQLL